MKETTAELVNLTDPASGETKIYIRFEGNGYKDKERFVLISKEEFDALVKLFVEGIIATAKKKNEIKPEPKKVAKKGGSVD